MTSTVAIATSSADSEAIDAVRVHHAELLGGLSAHVQRLVSAATRSEPTASAQQDLVRWCERELVPHALAEEETLYPAAGALTEGRLLVAAMTDQHTIIRHLVSEVAAAHDAVAAAVSAVALRVLFESHMTTENEQILPLLAGDPGISLAGLLDNMHGALGAARPEDDPGGEAADHHGGHACACGETDDEMPELDARVVPHAIRHATIFGALDAVGPGQGMVLVAPHDPLPLLAQIEERAPGSFTVEYLERGPEAWRLQFVRTA